MPQKASGVAKSMLCLATTSSTSGSDLDANSSNNNNSSDEDVESSSSIDVSDYDGGEFRPPPGAMKTLRKTQRMSLRSSPRKNAPTPPQSPLYAQQPKSRGRPPKLLLKPKKPKEKMLNCSPLNNKNAGRRPSSAAYAYSSPNKASPSSTFSPRQSPRKRCSAAPSSSNPPTNLPDELPTSIKIEMDRTTPMEKKAAKLLSSKRIVSSPTSNLPYQKIASSSPPHSPIRFKKSTEKKIKNGCSPLKMLKLMNGAKRRGQNRVDLVKQNAILETRKRPSKMEGIRAKKTKAMMLGKMGKRSAKMAAMMQMRRAMKKQQMVVKKEEEIKRHLSSSEEEDEIEDDDDELLYTIANDKMMDNFSNENEEMDEEEEEESSEEEKESSEEENEELIDFKLLNRFRHRQNCTIQKGNTILTEKVDGRSKQILEDEKQQPKAEPKRRGRKPAALNNNIQNNVVGIAGRKRINPSNTDNFSDPMSLKFNDFSNPFDAELQQNSQIDDQQMDGYQRKMRDLVDLDRYLGQPDCRRGFTRRPIHRPFLLRNLFYMQKQRPLTNNKKPWMGSDMVGVKQQQQTQRPNSTQQMSGGSRGDSRASNKMPATIKFTLIRNNNCFGNKSAIVQCFHATELNGRLSQLKRIPSSIFEKPVNDKINTCIDIDMLEECQPNNVLMDTKSNRSEHFVVRVVFRFEDAEIGGRHLRKVPSRQLNGVHVEHQNIQQQQNNVKHKNLRKSRSGEEPNEVVMFGAVRIFSHTPECGLNAVVGETFIILHTAAELQVNDLNTKSPSSQIIRLLNMENKKSGICVPFIRIVVLNDEEEDDEEGEDEAENDDGEIVGGLGARLARERLVEELAEMEASIATNTATTMMGMGTRKTMNSCQNSGGGNSSGHQFELLQEPIPQRIAIKFLLQPPPLTNNSSIPPFQPLFLSSFQPNGHCGVQHHHQQQLGGQPAGMKRTKLLRLSDSSADEQNDRMMDMEDKPLVSLDDEELAMRAQFGMLDGFDLAALEPKREFTVRIISPSQCFFCRAPLRIRNLWTLLKHLRFVHPRFQFTFDPVISLKNNCANSTTTTNSGPSTLPGFSVTLNPRFDASFELRPSLRFSTNMPNIASQAQQHFDNGSFTNNSNNRKRHFLSRPTWLVTKALAQKLRTNENFPIDRFTVISQQQWGEYEYLLSMGRFDFGSPARMDQLWLIQTGSRKLEDITDLHPAEKLMMQMWDGFLPRVRLTMLGHKLTYAAARIFVHHHWRQIGQLKLRTHFLLLLTTLLNANAIDEDERYDLIMRLNGPGYSAGQDPCHWVSRELAQLEREKLLNGCGTGHGQQCIQQQIHHQQNEPAKRQTQQHQNQNNIHHREKGSNANNNSNPVPISHKKHHHTVNQQPTYPPMISTNNFGSLALLRSHFPLATTKRLAQIWKFLRHYDFPDFALISSVLGGSLLCSPSQMPNHQFMAPRSSQQSVGSNSSGFFSGQSSKNSSTSTKSSTLSLASTSTASSSSSSSNSSSKSSITIAKLNANRN